MSRERLALGSQGEALALAHLKGLGYRILERNCRSRLGEIDIVAEEAGAVVFIEVKTRVGARFGSPLESVTLRKQRQISRAALDYIERHGLQGRAARFDVVGIEAAADKPLSASTVRLELIRNAFDLAYGV